MATSELFLSGNYSYYIHAGPQRQKQTVFQEKEGINLQLGEKCLQNRQTDGCALDM